MEKPTNYIDWISPKEHASFNRAFFHAIQDQNATLYVFSEQMRNDKVKSIYIAAPEARLARAKQVLKLCWEKRAERVFLMTYDPLMVPIAALICRSLRVFEHNTTPEETPYNKHAIWQSIFTRRIVRLCQFPGQVRRLKGLGQNCHYLGSPLPAHRPIAPKTDGAGHFVLASYRSSAAEIVPLVPFIQGADIVIKRKALEDASFQAVRGVQFRPVDFFEIDQPEAPIRGLIIAIRSAVRGTGWFNDAICRGIPILITSPETATLFEQTFPDVPYVRIFDCKDQDEFDAQLRACTQFDASAYITAYNRSMKERFRQESAGYR